MVAICWGREILRALRETQRTKSTKKAETDPVWKLSIGFLKIKMSELSSERRVRISMWRKVEGTFKAKAKSEQMCRNVE